MSPSWNIHPPRGNMNGLPPRGNPPREMDFKKKKNKEINKSKEKNFYSDEEGWDSNDSDDDDNNDQCRTNNELTINGKLLSDVTLSMKKTSLYSLLELSSISFVIILFPFIFRVNLPPEPSVINFFSQKKFPCNLSANAE